MMSPQVMRPEIPFQIVKWYGYLFAFTYILYGGVTIVLGVLDRNTEGFVQAAIFLAFGALLAVIVIAFRDGKKWGLQGMIVLNALIVLLALFGLSHVESWILIGLSAMTFALLMTSSVKDRF